MKKNILILTSLLLFSCNQTPPTIEKGNLENVIMIASDTHLLANTLLSETNELYIKENLSTDGRVQELDYQLFLSLINDVNNIKPNYFILTGDLTFNGEKESHIEYIKLLKTIDKNVKVLVIPGNHDTYSMNPYSFINDNRTKTDGITDAQFVEIYDEFGFNSCISKDELTSSYFYELDNKHWVLMLDTSLNRHNVYYGTNLVSGLIEDPTFSWLESNLKYAYENNIDVISFSHHNLHVHNELFKNSYTLANNESVISLYNKYNVKINFSGHLHIQSIKNKSKLIDVASVSLLDYGNRYGLLKIYDNAYEYSSNKVNYMFNDINFEEYSFNTFYQEYYDKTINNLVSIHGENSHIICDILSKINAYYFDGDYEKVNEIIKNNKEYIKLIKNKTPNYKTSYIKSIIEMENKNNHYFLISR